ncbi:MAG: glutaredoxin 3 [Gammaproteobacteria bacterium]|nr:glutaredoxin 3 [Gammaproteobacteria bacterium]
MSPIPFDIQSIHPQPVTVEVYTKKYCPYCDRALELIQSKHADIVVIDLGIYPERIPEMMQRTHGKRTVPQIFVNNHYIGGCDDLYRMQALGQLDSFFQ